VLVQNYDLARQLVKRGRKQKAPGIEQIARLIPAPTPTPVETPETSTEAGSTTAPEPAPAPSPAK
jgi:hypothetical protein